MYDLSTSRNARTEDPRYSFRSVSVKSAKIFFRFIDATVVRARLTTAERTYFLSIVVFRCAVR